MNDTNNQLWTRRCYYCKRPFGFGFSGCDGVLKRTRDHIIPKSRGGIFGKDNLIDACHVCNGLKANKTPTEFSAELIKILRNRKFDLNNRQYFETVLESTIQLIHQIGPYQQNLLRKGFTLPPSPAFLSILQSYQFTYACTQSGFIKSNKKPLYNIGPYDNLQPLAESEIPKPLVSAQQFEKRIAERYPYVYDQLADLSPDLPRWIFDNLLVLAHK